MVERDIEISAHDAWEKGEYERAFELFHEGAAYGLVGCMLDLGYFYDEGIGTTKDKAKAMSWYKRAYRKGSSAAASNIAILYREQRRNLLSFQWFFRATQLGDGDAELELAKLYFEGKGVRASVTLTKACLLKAMSSFCITEDSREQAAELLRKVENDL